MATYTVQKLQDGSVASGGTGTATVPGATKWAVTSLRLSGNGTVQVTIGALSFSLTLTGGSNVAPTEALQSNGISNGNGGFYAPYAAKSILLAAADTITIKPSSATCTYNISGIAIT